MHGFVQANLRDCRDIEPLSFWEPRNCGELDIENEWERGLRFANFVSMVRSFQCIVALGTPECTTSGCAVNCPDSWK